MYISQEIQLAKNHVCKCCRQNVYHWTNRTEAEGKELFSSFIYFFFGIIHDTIQISRTRDFLRLAQRLLIDIYSFTVHSAGRRIVTESLLKGYLKYITRKVTHDVRCTWHKLKNGLKPIAMTQFNCYLFFRLSLAVLNSSVLFLCRQRFTCNFLRAGFPLINKKKILILMHCTRQCFIGTKDSCLNCF